MKSWKTTSAGLTLLLTNIIQIITLYTDHDPLSIPDWNVVIPNLVVAIGLLFAKDYNATGPGGSTTVIETNKNVTVEGKTEENSNLIIR